MFEIVILEYKKFRNKFLECIFEYENKFSKYMLHKHFMILRNVFPKLDYIF